MYNQFFSRSSEIANARATRVGANFKTLYARAPKRTRARAGANLDQNLPLGEKGYWEKRPWFGYQLDANSATKTRIRTKKLDTQNQRTFFPNTTFFQKEIFIPKYEYFSSNELTSL